MIIMITNCIDFETGIDSFSFFFFFFLQVWSYYADPTMNSSGLYNKPIYVYLFGKTKN